MLKQWAKTPCRVRWFRGGAECLGNIGNYGGIAPAGARPNRIARVEKPGWQQGVLAHGFNLGFVALRAARCVLTCSGGCHA